MTACPRRPIGQAILFVLLGIELFTISGCSRPPQVVNDEECFSAVDALWTAVTSKRSELVEQTASEFDRLQEKGSLSRQGHESLTKIVNQARAQEWQAAARNLKAFMLGQRKART